MLLICSFFSYIFTIFVVENQSITDGNRLFLHIVYKEVDINFAAEQKTVANGK